MNGGGSADLYCVFCGGPTYSRHVITDIELLKKYIGIKKIKNNNIVEYYNVKPDGIWGDALSLIEYIKKHNKKIDNKEFDILIKSCIIPKNHNWQNKLTIILPDKVIKNVTSSHGEYYTVIDNIAYGPNEGYLVHNDCYKLLGRPKFNNIDKKIYKIKYNIINKYQAQFFYSPLAFIENSYLLESPLKNIMNKKRIMNLKLPIIIRPSPTKSATLYDVGTKKRGNDGNIWIIKENTNKIKRWSKI